MNKSDNKAIFLLYLFLIFPVVLVQAQETLTERVYVHLDKECYVAGEDIYMKFFTTGSDFKASDLSKVGYIEIADTEKPQIQHIIALDKGRGSSKVSIPHHIPSGIYQLTGYTRYMRNEGEKSFFSRHIAIVNVTESSESDRVVLQPDNTERFPIRELNSIQVKTDKGLYGNRSEVELSLSGIPSNVSDLVISVSRNDSVTSIPGVDKNKWVEDVRAAHTSGIGSQFLPEYEGHIISGNVVPLNENSSLVNAGSFYTTLGFVGRDIHIYAGQVSPDNTVNYYTEEIYGPQEIVTGVNSYVKELSYRIDITSPYHGKLPDNLPELLIDPDNEPLKKRLLDRSVAAQINRIMRIDSTGNPVPLTNYYNIEPHLSYDLDEYTRFNTMSETFIEYVRRIIVRRVDGERRLKVLKEDAKRYNAGNTLVLLDGVPIYDHEDIINYNPRLVKRIHIYSGSYLFGGRTFECMVSFTTHRANLPSIQLDEQSQLISYDCPALYEPFPMPDYRLEKVRESRIPDLRHTIYWNPYAEEINHNVPVRFYTSDLSGHYRVIVEGITDDGRMVYGSTDFVVATSSPQ